MMPEDLQERVNWFLLHIDFLFFIFSILRNINSLHDFMTSTPQMGTLPIG